MKIQNKMTNALNIFAIMSVLILGISFSPVFAASNTSTGPFSPTYASPSGSRNGSLGQTCAEVYSNGEQDGLFATSTSGSTNADAENNEDLPDILSPGTSPILTSSQSSITGSASLTYGYDMTIPSGSTAYYEPSVSIFDSNGFLQSCGGTQYTTSGGGIDSASVTVKCNYSNSGSDTFYMGLDNLAYVNSGGSTTIVNMWPSNYGTSISSMTICDDGTY
jgi:hypothetical protein